MDEDESGTIEFDEMVTYFDQAAYAHPVFYTTLLRCMKQVHCPFIKRRTRVLLVLVSLSSVTAFTRLLLKYRAQTANGYFLLYEQVKMGFAGTTWRKSANIHWLTNNGIMVRSRALQWA